MADASDDKRGGKQQGRHLNAKKRKRARSQRTATETSVIHAPSQLEAGDHTVRQKQKQKQKRSKVAEKAKSVAAASTAQDSGTPKTPPTSNWAKLQAVRM